MNINNHRFYIMRDPDIFWTASIAKIVDNKIVGTTYGPSTSDLSVAGIFQFDDLLLLVDSDDYGIKDVKSGEVYKFDWGC